jgi:hypothetical protein
MSRCRPRIIVRVLLGLPRHAADVDPFRPKRAKQGRFKHPGVIGPSAALSRRRSTAPAPSSCGPPRSHAADTAFIGAICSSEADAQCFEALQRMRNTPSISAALASSPSTDRRHGRRQCRNTAGDKRCLRRARRLETNAVCGQCVNTDRQMLAVPFDRIESHD